MVVIRTAEIIQGRPSLPEGRHGKIFAIRRHPTTQSGIHQSTRDEVRDFLRLHTWFGLPETCGWHRASISSPAVVFVYIEQPGQAAVPAAPTVVSQSGRAVSGLIKKSFLNRPRRLWRRRATTIKAIQTSERSPVKPWPRSSHVCPWILCRSAPSNRIWPRRSADIRRCLRESNTVTKRLSDDLRTFVAVNIVSFHWRHCENRRPS